MAWPGYITLHPQPGASRLQLSVEIATVTGPILLCLSETHSVKDTLQVPMSVDNARDLIAHLQAAIASIATAPQSERDRLMSTPMNQWPPALIAYLTARGPICCGQDIADAVEDWLRLPRK